MITTYFLGLFASLVALIFSGLPVVGALPFGLDAAVASMMAYVWAFTQVFWLLTPIVMAFLIYIPAKIVLMGIRLAMGSRVPDGS